MQAIILAAGKASRLGDITQDTPKCLLDISGKCSLGRMLENLKYSGINHVKIVNGFQKDKIVQYLQNNEKDWTGMYIEFVVNKDWETTNNAYSLNLALKDVQEDILVCNADVVCYKDLIRELVEFPEKNAMAVVRKKELNEEDMKVFQDNEGNITLSKNLSLYTAQAEFTGIFKIKKEDLINLQANLEYVLKNNTNCWFEEALEICLFERYFQICDVSHYPYIEVDFPKDLEEARDRFPYDQPAFEQGGRHESLKEGKRNLDDAWELIWDFTHTLETYNIRWWFNWGALLAIIREGELFKWDTDIDICIDDHNEKKLWERVVPYMRDRYRCFVPKKEEHEDSDCFVIRCGERIECNTMKKMEDKYIYSPERCKLGCPAKYLDELTETIIRGKYIRIPKYAEEMLAGWYGPNWHIPSETKPKSFEK